MLAAPVLALSLFTFQNNFWVNLHQFVYAEATRRRLGTAPSLAIADLPEAERQEWIAALDGYRDLSRRDLLFDRVLVAANDALARGGEPSRLADGVADAAVVAALNRAAPIYRARLWPRHRAINEAWIRRIQSAIDEHGAALTQALARAYGTAWPSSPILVDVSYDAGPFGAYTTDGGPAGFAAHATIAPVGDAAEGDMGIESIFHEASHAVDAHIMRIVNEESARQGVRATRNLWHAIIFYTTGELVRRELGKVGDAHYQPYAYRFDVYSKGMTAERAALETDWQPYLDGKTTLEEALRNVVRTVGIRR